MKYNWTGDGTPGGCDNHCIPSPCGPCITGKGSEQSWLRSKLAIAIDALKDAESILLLFQREHDANAYIAAEKAQNIIDKALAKLDSETRG